MPAAKTKKAPARSSSSTTRSTNGRTAKKDAFGLLKADHQNVMKMFRQYERSREGFQEKQEMAQTIIKELEAHATVEEELFYPEGRSAEGKLTELINEGYEEHHVVKTIMEEMKGFQTEEAEGHGGWEGMDEFDAKLKVMMENVEHHIQEEEGQMFPLMKKHLGSRAAELGTQMEQRKQSMLATTAPTRMPARR
jgi:hemerythrin superfamily protein